jgi:uncharacterized membrane protein
MRSSSPSISSASNENVTNALEIRHFCRAEFAEHWCTRKDLTVLHRATPERLSAFSDGVFAVLITILVLELRPPEIPTFNAAWMAVSKLAPEPVAFYAVVFFLVNATYICLVRELVDRTHDVAPRVRRIMRFRSITTLCLFGMAAVVALKYPLVGLAICIGCLIVYLRPDPLVAGRQRSRSASR